MKTKISLTLIFLSLVSLCKAQSIIWATDGNSYYSVENNNIMVTKLLESKNSISSQKEIYISKAALNNLPIQSFSFSTDFNKLLIFTNTKKVWRYNTRGDYWLYDISTKKIKQLGKSLPASSLMFAKISPDGNNIAYVSNYNLYSENIETNAIKPLTTDGNRQLINGTFDWAYEEEFFCRDGFRWGNDSKSVAFWQIDAKGTKDYLMLTTIDSIYPRAIPVEYPIAGEQPSRFKIGVVQIATAATKWMQIPDDEKWGNYLPRMEWTGNNNELILQLLSRKQNESTLLICNTLTGFPKNIYNEKDAAWIDTQPLWDERTANGGWDWLNNKTAFIWASEKDGWRHLYKISADGKAETLLTKGNYDVMKVDAIDEKSGYIYFHASPANATQKYLYRVKLNGEGQEERITPANQIGTNEYDLSPDGRFAKHNFSNYYTKPVAEWVTIPAHKSFNNTELVNVQLQKSDKTKSPIEFFTVKTVQNVTMDGWMVKPKDFDSTKKYPVLFYVYTEPWGQNVIDRFGVANNRLYKGDMSADGYIYISIDNRGTPCPKGREWRKSIYRKIGQVNISEQAMAAKEILKWNYVDTSRVAVWGWSGGGSATLNLMFQYPEIYKTGIAIAAVGNQLTYDNIYQERYMGLPQENEQDFINGSPITHAKNLKGNLLYIHGTGDDNVHYNNAEMLINELVKHEKQFQLMCYPNRTHSINEGPGTKNHLINLYTDFLKLHCPPGGIAK